MTNWAEDQMLIGDYAIRSIGSDDEPLGSISFCLLNTGDAYVLQVQGIKGRSYTPEIRNQAFKTALNYFQKIGINRVFLNTGKLFNDVRIEPNQELVEIYAKIAKDLGFKDQIWYMPYIQVTPPTEN